MPVMKTDFAVPAFLSKKAPEAPATTRLSPEMIPVKSAPAVLRLAVVVPS